jgi:predicted MFS family arabinose efflux permease
VRVSVRVLASMSEYRRLFASRLISNIGNGVAPIAIAFGVLALPDGSPTGLSVVLTAQAIPAVLVLPIGGVIADRVGRPRMIGICDTIQAVVVGAIGLLFITGLATVPLLACLSALVGVLNGLWYPAYPGLATDVVPDKHLQPANAYMSVAGNGGFVVGTALGGLLVAAIGSGWAILIDGVSFLIAGLLVFSLRRFSRPHRSGESPVRDLLDGWKVFVSYRWIVAVVVAFSFVVMVMRGAEEVLGPVLANERYGGPAGWSAILGALSVGLLLGAVVASRLRPSRPIALGMAVCFALPAWLISLAVAAPLPVVMLFGFVWGVAIEILQVFWLTALQRNVPAESLSRVSSYDAFGSLIFGPIGLALAGPMLAFIPISEAFAICAVVSAAAVAGALLVPSVWRLRRSDGLPTMPKVDTA